MAAFLTPAQAAQRLNVDRSTISRMLTEGKIEGRRDNRGRWRIDPQNLPEAQAPEPDPARHEIDGLRTELAASRERIARLEGEAEGSAALLIAERERREGAERDRDNWREIAGRLSRAAGAAVTAPDPTPEPSRPEEGSGIVGRLLGRLRRR